jgi:uncharacterized protein YecE (DUF72 family)
MSKDSTHWYAGTSGYSYKEWKGSFYPADMSNSAMLPYYAVQLPAVEINNTFYRMPRTHALEGWHDAVGPDFRFVIKASRRITHQLRLKDAAEPVEHLARKLDVLGDKLGAVLFQLPPYLHHDLDRLQDFLAILPKNLPAAIEFRHASWFDDAVFDALERHGCGLCVSDDGKFAIPERVATTNWAYLRLRQPGYSDAALNDWIERVAKAGARQGYAFFKHEDEAVGPALARRFLDLAETEPTTARPPKRATRRSATGRKPAHRTQG